MPRFPAGLLLTCFLIASAALLADDAPVVLANDRVEVGFAPHHGLILGFGPAGGRNLIWLNPHPLASTRLAGWSNFGGEKLWWGPQVDWAAVQGRRFPPDEALDGPWQVVTADATRVVARSGVSPWVGIRAEREIALARDFAGLVVRNRFTRVRPSPHRVQLWTVCMLVPPRWCWLDSQPPPGAPPFRNLRPELPPGSHVRFEPAIGCVRVTPSPNFAERFLIGTRGTWLAAVYDDVILVHEVTPYPDGAYPEDVSLQVFAAPAYVEIETLGGTRNLAVGETVANTVRWHLLPRPPGLDEPALGRWLREQLSPLPRP